MSQEPIEQKTPKRFSLAAFAGRAKWLLLPMLLILTASIFHLCGLDTLATICLLAAFII
jgi:hypothetical protein